ncbi:glycine cleavage system protein GcvH [bacterium]|nr:MAG: glycine cleavage system protein GcvH [bacterium]|tara:strand:- start:272 stop:649 length:378 start_codon:yes stop_codon:yes gene_type:complete
MDLPENIKYTEDHEWVSIKDDIATVGITDFAQSELGDIIFVEFPDEDMSVDQKESVGTLEAVKTVADIFSPLTGNIIELNENLESNPELINEDPYSNGWILKIKMSNPSEYNSLLSNTDYEKLIK